MVPMVIKSPGEQIGPDAVPPDIGPAAIAVAADGWTPGPGPLKDQKAAAERAIVLAALERCRWHATNTAHDLGLADHSSLLKIMRRHGLKR